MKASDFLINDLLFAVWASITVAKITLDTFRVKYMTALQTHQLTIEVLQTDGTCGNFIQGLQQIFNFRFTNTGRFAYIHTRI